MKKGRTYCIGDIHGGYRALDQLIGKLLLQRKDTLIFLGDYVDGWSESAQTIDCLMRLSDNVNCIFIKGNHDYFCEDWLRDGTEGDLWLDHGGKQTIESYDGYSISKKKEHLDFFGMMKPYFIDEQNRLFIHAGFTSMHGVAKEVYPSNYCWDRTLWEMALAMKNDPIPEDSKFYPSRFKHYNEIFIGHTPTTNYGVNVPIQAHSLWNVDTGAGFKGCLTALDVNSKEYYQSDPVFELYPTEKGRN
ncbi:MAG: serine/threonine protein phosphatase [Flavobacteriales bacterium]|nr:serine/threonine protein phosphatase [Flavobacteriales bacterium]